MPEVQANNTTLYHGSTGTGESIVLVHGGMVDSRTWEFLVPHLADRFHVVAYDRRGYGRSDGSPVGDAKVHASDLAALIVALGLAPVHVVAISSGGVVALRLAADRPDLVRRVALHEPALIPLLTGDRDTQPILDDFLANVDAVCEHVAAGRPEAAAERFADFIVAPGAWQLIPAGRREMMVANAPNVLADCEELEETFSVPVDHLGGITAPVLLSKGDRSPDVFSAVVDRLVSLLPDNTVRTIPDAGHVPHVTHPAEFAALVAGFLEGPSDRVSAATS